MKDLTTREPSSGARPKKGNRFPHPQKTQRREMGRDGEKLQSESSRRKRHVKGSRG